VPRLHLVAESSAPPDRVLAAARDFSDRRPELWPNIDRFEVHELGDDFADVTEGTNFLGDSWARERYDWSQPGMVRATTTDSNIFRRGSWQITATPRDGGSHVEVINDREMKGLKGGVVGVAMRLGKPMLTRQLKQFLSAVEGQSPPR
jgi:hypothetical protein